MAAIEQKYPKFVQVANAILQDCQTLFDDDKYHQIIHNSEMYLQNLCHRYDMLSKGEENDEKLKEEQERDRLEEKRIEDTKTAEDRGYDNGTYICLDEYYNKKEIKDAEDEENKIDYNHIIFNKDSPVLESEILAKYVRKNVKDYNETNDITYILNIMDIITSIQFIDDPRYDFIRKWSL
jgi:hypothetical protein